MFFFLKEVETQLTLFMQLFNIFQEIYHIYL